MTRRPTRRRWRRPERMTLDHAPIERRKDLTAPDLLTLEPDLARAENRRREVGLLGLFIAIVAIEVALVAWLFRSWVPLLAAVAVVVYLALAPRFGDRWIRHAMGAHPADAPRFERITRAVARSAGADVPHLYLVARDDCNAVSFAAAHPWLAVTTGAADLPDLDLEAVVAHEIVHLRDGESKVASWFVMLAGAPELALRAAGARGGILAWLALPAWPAAVVVRAARRWWIDPDREHRADVAAALLTRYPPGVVAGLRSCTGGGAPGIGVATSFWFAPRHDLRAELIAEM